MEVADFLRQHHEIRPEVAEALRAETENIYAPDEWFRLATAAGILVRQERCSLVSEPLSSDPDMPNHPAAQQFVSIANQSLTPTVDPERPNFTQCPRTLEACPQSEYLFGSTIRAAEDPAWALETSHMGYRIFVDEENQPTLLQKGSNVASGLALVPLTIRGITYQPGSLVRVEVEDDETTYRYPGSAGRRWGRHVIAESQISSMSFIRLTAFTQKPHERDPFINAAEIYPPLNGPATEVLATYSLTDIRTVVALSTLRHLLEENT